MAILSPSSVQSARIVPVTIATILALLISAASLLYLARQTAQLRDTNRFEVAEASHEALRGRRDSPGNTGDTAYFDIRRQFDGDRAELARNPPPGEVGYELSLVERIRIVHDLAPAQRQADFVGVKHLVDAYNRVGELIDNGLLDSRSVLATYHVAIIRELFIAEPYIWHRMLFERPGRYAMRVLRLGEMARAYNSMNPIHRRDVTFEGDPAYGTILRSPQASELTLRAWQFRLRWIGAPRISARSKLAQERLAIRLRDALDAPYPTRDVDR